MTVHRGVQLLAGIGLIVAYGQACIGKEPHGVARGAVILIVEQRHFPRTFRVGVAFQRRREAVQRDDQGRFCVVQPLCQRRMVRPVIARQPPFDVRADIAWYGVPVAGDRHHGGLVLASVQVADEAADRGDMHRDPVPARQTVGDALDSDIDCDMGVEQRRVDA